MTDRTLRLTLPDPAWRELATLLAARARRYDRLKATRPRITAAGDDLNGITAATWQGLAGRIRRALDADP